MDRERLTITLKKDVIKRLDETIDGARIRNRSHAIEYLLNQSLSPKISKALVLAGGRGISMRPFTYEMPKTMIPLRNKPILEYTIEKLRNAGIRDLLVHIGHLGDKIQSHFGDGKAFGVNITYQTEKNENGTAAPLRTAKSFFKNQPFLLHYGDVVSDIDIHDFIDFHLMASSIASMALTSMADNPADFGVVRLHGTKVVSFKEKPGKGKRVSSLVNSGIYIFEPKVFNYVPKTGYSMLEKDVIPKLLDDNKLTGYVFSGRWFDISSPEIYEKAIKEWQ
ncbi:MAG: sugar phosphate nucleotidyltransferase [Patescibacteria group bacterium]